METALISPAKALILGLPAVIFSVVIPLAGIGIFIYIMIRRMAPIIKSAPDHRFNRIFDRVIKVIKIWLLQYRQPRYMLAGVLHILIFAGFLILSIRSTSLVLLGFWEGFVIPGFSGALGHIYNFLKDYAATWVLIACIISAIRRGIFKPERYAVPKKYGHDHTKEAVFVLGLISLLMISESLFEGSLVAAKNQSGVHAEFLPPLTIAWFFSKILSNTSQGALQNAHLASYFVHDITFFFFSVFSSFGKAFSCHHLCL